MSNRYVFSKVDFDRIWSYATQLAIAERTSVPDALPRAALAYKAVMDLMESDSGMLVPIADSSGADVGSITMERRSTPEQGEVVMLNLHGDALQALRDHAIRSNPAAKP